MHYFWYRLLLFTYERPSIGKTFSHMRDNFHHLIQFFED